MNIIFFLHFIIFMAGMLVPFMGTKKILNLYSLFIPFLFFHWSLNDDTCALTQIEMFMTGKQKEESFMGRLIGPIYNMDDSELSKLTKSMFFGLWTFVQYKLGRFSSI